MRVVPRPWCPEHIENSLVCWILRRLNSFHQCHTFPPSGPSMVSPCESICVLAERVRIDSKLFGSPWLPAAKRRTPVYLLAKTTAKWGRARNEKSTAEYWAFMTCIHAGATRALIESNECEKAVWAAACTERFRSMLFFKDHLEEVIWMGHSAKRLLELLGIWNANQQNDDLQKPVTAF